ncbi:MAG: glycosyltransferase [Desulfovibrionaceae bacterium]|nr:glycosyltransferase [Desulfovibrionaceae bacterium]
MPKARDLVSVVIPTYNRAELLMHTLASVLGQTYPALEVLVVDDGSTDDTAERVRGLADPRIRYLRTERSGLPAAARNAGLAQAAGEYVAFVDSDDLWLPRKIEKQVQLLEKSGLKWCYCDHYIFDHDTGLDLRKRSHAVYLAEGPAAQSLILTNFIGSPTPLVSRAVLERAGGFDPDPGLRFVEDWDLWLRIAPEYPLGCVREPLARYRIHPANSTRAEDVVETALKSFAVAAKAARLFPALYGPLRKVSVAAHCRAQARKLLAAGEQARARRLVGLAAQEIGSFKGLVPTGLACLVPAKLLRVLAESRRARAQSIDG